MFRIGYIKKVILAILLLSLFINVVDAQYAYMVKDVSALNERSYCTNFTQVGATTYFAADDYFHGRELWKTDGTTQGTVIVKDIIPGMTSGCATNLNFIEYNNLLYFTKSEYGGVIELWKSDGTENGTVLVKSLEEGSELASEFIMLNNKLLFFVTDGYEHILYLYKSDGTTNGTTIIGGYEGVYSFDEYYTIMNNQIYFRPEYGTLCKSDGTYSGTDTVRTGLRVAGVTPSDVLVSLNGYLYFIGYDSNTGYELYKSDGTYAGTQVLKDILPGVEQSQISNLSIHGNNLYFTADNGTNGKELWISDGSALGTQMITDLNPVGNSLASDLYYYDNQLYFTAYNGMTWALYRTDGTDVGTIEIHPMEYSLTNLGDSYFEYQDELYFLDWDDNMWVTDGTYEGTYIFTEREVWDVYVRDYGMFVVRAGDTEPLELAKYNSETNDFTVIYTGLFYSNAIEYDDSFIFLSSGSDANYEPYISDGTVEGTFLLKDINTYGDSEIRDLVAVNDELFFKSNEIENYLWETNGHSTGTHLIDDTISSVFPFNDNLMFIRDSKLWMTDVQGSEPVEVMDTISQVKFSEVYNDTLFFHYRDKIYRLKPFTSIPEVIFDEPTSNMYINTFEKVGNDFYISGQHQGIIHVDLLTLTPTTLFSETPLEENLFPCGDTLYFTANYITYDTLWFDETNYYVFDYSETRLYKTSGTSPILVAPLNIDNGLLFNNKLFFDGYYNSQSGLFCYDVIEDTVIYLLHDYGYLKEFTEFNDELFFVYTDENEDREIWKSDGTVDGTIMLKNINSIEPSYPAYLTVKDNYLYFSADDGINGKELWSSNGTENGTQLLADIYIGGSSSPAYLTVSGNNIYFVAYEEEFGRELWAYGLSTTENCFAYFETDYDSVQNAFILSIDSVTLANANSYFWDFGDGSYSNELTPSHEYSTDDLFEICMTAYTNLNDSCTFCHEIGKDAFGNIYKDEGFAVVVEQYTDLSEELDSGDWIEVFPNPATDYINVVFNLETIEAIGLHIMDYKGKIVYNDIISGSQQIYISNLPPGIYFLLLRLSDSGYYSRKIIIQ